ncbi:MAG TPA: DUF167 domain-containing protein [Methanomicrobiales archaeon]|nr:DUF167 domain-containing protein [Methanomicrobiales archaeon]
MDSFGDAVTAAGSGVIVSLDVSPGRSGAEFIVGYDPWRKAIRCSVGAPPVQGKANREVVESLAELLGVPTKSVQIVSGSSRSRKQVKLEGVSRDQVLERLGRFL